jgi:hypothetical protein
MSEDSFSLSTKPEVLLALGVNDAVAESERPMCWNYADVFSDRGEKAEADDSAEVATAWRLLGQLSRLGLQESTPNQPFRPMFEGPNGRSLMPSDLDQVTADAVRQLGFAIEDPELRARLLDIT